MSEFAVFVEGLSGLDDFKGLEQRLGRAKVQAINKAVRDGRVLAARRIGEQIAFPKSYLGPGQGRLTISKYAKPGSPEARIRARGRPTSLARFVTAETRGAGVSLQVHPGKATRIRRAFTVRLRSGSANIDTKANLGLAIRLRPGERLSNKIKQVQLAKGLVLLYGPSVQQVFLDNRGDGVAKEISPDVLDRMEQELLRLLRL